jgi:hypothetical protein
MSFSPFFSPLLMRRWRFGYLPLSLPYAPTPTDVRDWRAEIDPAATQLPVPFQNGDRLNASLHRILIEAGIALTPATSVLDPRSWFALYRYGADFAGTAPQLHLYPGAAQKDPRHTGVCAEEVSTGITCFVLHEHLALEHIADVFPLIRNGNISYVNAQLGKRPDYFCLDNANEAVLAESKGAVGTKSSIKGRIYPEGWDQVQNVQPVNHQLRASCGRVVLGTNICIDGKHTRSDTTTILKDPVGERGPDAPGESDFPIRLSYAKALRFAGDEVLADRLLLRQPLPARAPPMDDQLLNVKAVGMLPVGISPFGDVICLYGPTAKVLFAPEQPLERAVPDSLRGFREPPSLRDAADPPQSEWRAFPVQNR